MRRATSLFLFLLSILIAPLATHAENVTVEKFKRGSLHEIKAELKDQPFILVFWSKDCGYCFKEMNMLGRLQPRHPELNVVLVSTDVGMDEEVIKYFSDKSGIKTRKLWVFSDDSEQLYSYVDRNWQGELPNTFFHNSKHEYQSVIGEVKYKQVKRWLKYIRTEDS